MNLPNVLTESVFLAREFPSPANPYRPLAMVAPRPGQEAEQVAEIVQDLTCKGYGGLVIDPSVFGLGFLSEAWFELVGLYMEACRLTGLFVWVMDGFTIGRSMGRWLDGRIPAWRAGVVQSRSLKAVGPGRLDLELDSTIEGRIIGLLARAQDRYQLPINLLPRYNHQRLIWDIPDGSWQVSFYWVNETSGSPAISFAWTDAAKADTWLKIGLEPYHDRFRAHLGRTLQGVYAYCPTAAIPGAAPNEYNWPLLAGSEPVWSDLALWSGIEITSAGGQPYLDRYVQALAGSYLKPLRDWCWRHKLRAAGYRLGGAPFPSAMSAFDLGGLPDPDARADMEELAVMAGLGRHYRQERIAAAFTMSGDPETDRGELGALAAAGADLFLVTPRPGIPPDLELAVTEYAARLAMAVAAGHPAHETAVAISDKPGAMRENGRRLLALSHRGTEPLCRHAGVIAEPAAEPAAGSETGPSAYLPQLPPGLAIRIRAVEDWLVHTLINLRPERWRGPFPLTAPGSVEIWHPSTGEERQVPAVGSSSSRRPPLVLEAGEALVAVIKPALPAVLISANRLVQDQITLKRSWRFEAPGGNRLPLAWHEEIPGHWSAAFTVLARPDRLTLAERPYPCLAWLNGQLISFNRKNGELQSLLAAGENKLELRLAHQAPRAYLAGDFTCRGMAIDGERPRIAGPWTQNGYPFLNGPGIYHQQFTLPRELFRDGLAVRLEIGALAEAALIRVNGQPLGSIPWPPYRLELGRVTDCLRPGENQLALEIYVAGDKPPWTIKGLLGEVSLLFMEL